MDAALPLILEDADANLSGAVRLLLAQLKLDLDQLSVRMAIRAVFASRSVLLGELSTTLS